MQKDKHKILQIIENMNIGGAQRTARNLMSMPNIDIQLVTYENLPDFYLDNYDIVLLHVWCKVSDGSCMNWPSSPLPQYKKLVIFNHDWHGVLSKCDKYLVYSSFAKENISKNSDEIEIVPGGIDLRLFFCSSLRTFEDKIVVGRLSTLLPGKINIDTIEFWRNLPAEKFIIGGSGPMLRKLKNNFKDDRRFSFPGAITPSRIGIFLNKIDVFIYDTAWHIESFCYVIVEAMASGCIVIAKNKGAIRELIDHGHNGFVYEKPQDVIDICAELKKDIGLRQRISNNAKLFSARFSLDKMHARVSNIFDEL